MTGKILPFSLFVLDCCLLALPLLLLGGRAVIPPSIMFLLAAIVAGVLMAAVLSKWNYHPLSAVGICLFVMSSVLIAGASVYLYVVFVLISVQRLHVRFSEQQDEYDGHFFLLFLLIFPFSLFALILWGEENRLTAFYAIAFFTLLFFTGSRLLYRYTLAAPAVSRSSFLRAAGLLVLLPAAGALVFYLAADSVRVALGTALGGILTFVLQPFEGLIETLLVSLEQLSLEPREAGERTESQVPPETSSGEVTVYTPPLPYEWLAIPFLALLIIVLVFWLRKQKYVNTEPAPAEAVSAEVSYGSVVLEEQEQWEKRVGYSAIDLPFIRKTFREFEREAMENGYGRDEAETVREWFSRLDWHVPAAFFSTYDSVRYGSQNISEADARSFLKEIEKIKKIFLQSGLDE